MSSVKKFARAMFPTAFRHAVRKSINNFQAVRNRLKLRSVRKRSERLQPGSIVPLWEYSVKVNDGVNYYVLYKDIFVNRIYHFHAERPDPVIVDCGSNIGMSILYFKHIYPKCRVIGFEPDPVVFSYLQENITTNRLEDVNVIQAGVGDQNTSLEFFSDGRFASYFGNLAQADIPEGWTRCIVPCVRLSDYLTEPVDFLKMNVEGAEASALLSCSESLRNVREMVVEYHHLPGLPRTLHSILSLLDQHGFAYLVNDFDPETNPQVMPPFQLTSQSRYFLLIYAKRID